MEALKDYADRLMRAVLRGLKPGVYRGRDFLDDDGFDSGPIPIQVAIAIRGGRAIVDFTGSAPQVRGPLNANFAITLSATFYVMKCLAAEAVPANEGLMRPIKLIAPPGSIVNALPPPRSPAATSRPRSASSTCCCARSRWRRPIGSPPPVPARCPT